METSERTAKTFTRGEEAIKCHLKEVAEFAEHPRPVICLAGDV
ncbi:MAG: hypothetical protein WA977_08565 [Halobacteriota archaeon]